MALAFWRVFVGSVAFAGRWSPPQGMAYERLRAMAVGPNAR